MSRIFNEGELIQLEYEVSEPYTISFMAKGEVLYGDEHAVLVAVHDQPWPLYLLFSSPGYREVPWRIRDEIVLKQPSKKKAR